MSGPFCKKHWDSLDSCFGCVREKVLEEAAVLCENYKRMGVTDPDVLAKALRHLKNKKP